MVSSYFKPFKNQNPVNKLLTKKLLAEVPASRATLRFRLGAAPFRLFARLKIFHGRLAFGGFEFSLFFPPVCGLVSLRDFGLPLRKKNCAPQADGGNFF
jgi:hypothetical protein